MSSCERTPKRSASDLVPSAVSKLYSFSTGTQGSSRRFCASSSLRRVSSFSSASSSCRAASNSSCVPTLCSGIAFPPVWRGRGQSGTHMDSLLEPASATPLPAVSTSCATAHCFRYCRPRCTALESRLVPHLVPHPKPETAIDHVRGPARSSHADPLLLGHCLGLFQRAGDAIAHECGQRRVAALIPTLGAAVADEHRNADRVAAGPAVCVVEDPAPDDQRAALLDHLRQVRGAGRCHLRHHGVAWPVEGHIAVAVLVEDVRDAVVGRRH